MSNDEDVKIMLQQISDPSVAKRVDAIGKKLPPMSAYEALALGIAIITGIRGFDSKVGIVAESAAVAALNHSIQKG